MGSLTSNPIKLQRYKNSRQRSNQKYYLKKWLKNITSLPAKVNLKRYQKLMKQINFETFVDSPSINGVHYYIEHKKYVGLIRALHETQSKLELIHLPLTHYPGFLNFFEHEPEKHIFHDLNNPYGGYKLKQCTENIKFKFQASTEVLTLKVPCYVESEEEDYTRNEIRNAVSDRTLLHSNGKLYHTIPHVKDSEFLKYVGTKRNAEKIESESFLKYFNL